ncbi:hypothetical protein SAMN05444410_10868 [Hydrobacter penzbergensis]|uniref:TerB family tellurite resistance protein n=1 Tax=Hydrobacter penzbergensis TaxID=1235997 RepID=A0A8X8IGE4_9BACT|nr:hypothetical protein [Hydrobacter penzbergensis]SDX02548.1 hypothetical protein SAMN05444410_10868 [Hydrobacter penzbergensis]
MKKIIAVIVILLLHATGFAQSQEMEQLKLNLEKLVQLKLMLQQMKQGYQTLSNGYNSVRDAARGNYDLHRAYLDGLLQVSEQVKGSPALQKLLTNHGLIQQEYRRWLQQVQPLGLFTAQELSDVQRSYQKILEAVSDQLVQLQLLTRPESLRMSDAERLSAIETLATKSDEQLVALRQLMKDQTSVAVRKAQQKRDLQAMRRLYGQ